MFFLGPITAILLAAATSSSNSNKSFVELRLRMCYDLAKEANVFVEKGQYQDAIPLYEEAIHMGRKPALALHEVQQQQGTS